MSTKSLSCNFNMIVHPTVLFQSIEHSQSIDIIPDKILDKNQPTEIFQTPNENKVRLFLF